MSDRTFGVLVYVSMLVAILLAAFVIFVGVAAIMGPADTRITIAAGQVDDSGQALIVAEPLAFDMHTQSEVTILAGDGGVVRNSGNVVNDYGLLVESIAFLLLGGAAVFVSLASVLDPVLRG